MKKTTLSTVLAGALIAAVLTAGCSTGDAQPLAEAPVPQAPGNTDGPRRATAHDILQAAQTGEVPEWFSPEERKAVEKLK